MRAWPRVVDHVGLVAPCCPGHALVGELTQVQFVATWLEQVA